MPKAGNAVTRYRAREPGFTLVEMLSVIGMIAVLAAILFPVFAKARERARQTSCVSNLVNIGLALKMYATDHDGGLPPTEDDLGALHPRYLMNGACFSCPSSYEGLPMGCPADAPPKPDDEDQSMGGPGGGMGPGGPGPMPGYPGAGPSPGAVPPGGGMPGGPGGPGPGGMPGGPGGMPGGPGCGGPGMMPGGQGGPGPGGMPGGPGMMPGGAMPGDGSGMPGPDEAETTLETSYYYRAGRSLDQTPARWLCSDNDAHHTDSANVLFTDGGIKRVPTAHWAGMGFQPARELMAERYGWEPPQPYYGGPPQGPPPGGG